MTTVEPAHGTHGEAAALAALAESIESGVLLFGADGELLLANERLADLLSVEAGHLRGMRDFEAAVANLAPRFAGSQVVATRWRQRFERDEACWDQLELERPAQKVIERFARPVRDAQGRRLGWLEIYRDVTDQRLTQTKMFHADRLAALGQLVSNVAHELSNPLTSILGNAQLLSRGVAGEADQVEQILEQAERASRIAKNLLLFVRDAKPEKNWVSLNEIAERTVALRRYDLRLENIRLEFILDPDLPPVLGDTVQIQQALLNLLLNAEQALNSSSIPERRAAFIRMRTFRRSGRRAAIEIADNGPGIAAEILPRIFDPFFTTKPPGVGTGLGLSIVFGIVREHGGDVLVESRPAQGASFTIELPFAAPAVTELADEVRRRAQGSLARGAAAAGATVSRGARILVVEDEPTVARLIVDVLSEEGHIVDAVLDSREGLQRITQREAAYDLVICDLRMPHLDGRAFYAELLQCQCPLAERLLFITGDVPTRHTLEFLEKTGAPYLGKPFLVDELKEIVRRALELSDAGAPRALSAAQWQPRVLKRR